MELLAMTTFLKSLAVRPLHVCVAILVATPAVWADTTNISDQPLATLPNVSAAPNLLFILDSSGSMASAYMPDDMSRTGAYGFYSSQCNGVAYDPSHTYTPPVDYTGTPFTPPTYPTAYVDGYKISSGSVDLSTSGSQNYYYTYSGSQPKMGWTYPISGKYPDGSDHSSATVDKSTTFYQECNTSKAATGYSAPVGGTAFNPSSATNPGYGVFTPVNVSDLTASQKQNYVNWYSYYRTRILMMRTAMGQGINPLSSSYNVGFTIISNKSAAPSSTFLDVKSFDASSGATSQKSRFYSDLYAAQPNNATPLRGAIAKAGQYYANKASGQTYDPMQYACQRNYALLSTDGYWNTGVESTTAPKYGPYQMDNSTNIDNQDAAEIAPMKDSSFVTTTTQTTFTSNANAATKTVTTTQTATVNWTRNALTTSSTLTSGKGYKIKTSQPQVYSKSSTITQTCTQQQTATASYIETKVAVDGTTTSDTNGSVVYTGWVDSGTASCTPSLSSVSQPSGGSWSAQGASSSYSGSSLYTSAAISSGYLSSAYTGSTFYFDPASGTAVASSPSVTSTSDSTPSLSGSYTAGTPNVSTVTTGDSLNTLADVAEYYYKTDLRNTSFGNCTSGSTSRDVCQDDVPTDASSGDTETIQHMNTFTLGLGVNGTVPYDSTVTPTSGTRMNWPRPTESTNGGDATNVDDLWHAALNGRGHYYSVGSASELSSAIAAVVAKIQAVNGSGSAGATSSLQLVAGGNQVFKASYTTVEWTGDVQAYPLAAATAAIGATADWSAQSLLDSLSLSSRKVYFNRGGSLGDFKYGNLSTAQKAYFDNFCSMSVVATQCTALAARAADGTTLPNLSTANNGSNLVDYLTGTRTYERSGVAVSGGSTTMPLYRVRTHLLGDIVNGAPVYVGKPPFSYVDAGYSDFVTAQASRAPVVYAAANDGMLHAFSAATTGSTGGTELWAFVPSAVMPNLYKLANTGYDSNHKYFVDGAPVMGDVYIGGHWKTILVGGFNDGGRGYYALDITDPNNPALLWEFSDSNLGLSYGNPVITKRKSDGSWVVAFGSGYNNTSGDGNGHLFVVDAATGTKLLDVCTDANSAGTVTGGCPTPVGSTGTPSGLAKINAWVESNSTDNTALRFYGGDLLGNVWRFDIDNQVAPNKAALLLATLKDASGTAQPITTKPLLSSVGPTHRPVVVVATGAYLSQPDTLTTTQQSIYAVADNLTGTGWGDPRGGANSAAFVVQSFTAGTGSGTPTESISSNTVDFSLSTTGGWYVDLPHSGERVFSNPTLELNTLAVSTGIPSSDACTSGGSSWLYYLNVANGNAVTTNPVGVQYSSEALIVGMNWVKDTSGNVHILVQDSKGGIAPVNPPVNQGTSLNATHRTSWRELTN